MHKALSFSYKELCSDLKITNGFYTGRFTGVYCFREEKP